MHLKDKRGGKGDWDFPAPGDGTIDFAGILGLLEAGGYDGPLSVEIEFQGTVARRSPASTRRMKAGRDTSRLRLRLGCPR